MARKKTLQTNFSAGEISPELGMRQDTDQYQNGAKSLRNRRVLIGGGTKRRPGSWWQAALPARARLESFVVNQDTQYIVAFTNGRADFFLKNTTTGFVTASGSISGCPWDATTYRQMDCRQSGNTMFVVHPSFAPQLISRTGAASWSFAAMTFYIGPANRPEQPYLKVVAQGVTLAPSALTGSITLTASQAVFVAAHVGQYIRYLSKACLITAVAGNGLSCTATVIEKLPVTQALTVSSSANFAVGEVVEGATSFAKGQVTAITDSTHLNVVVIEKLTPFTAENLTGPNAVTAISSASDTTSAAVTDWDEQLFGPVYGYPSCVELHRNRLLFGGHSAAPDYLIASTLNNLYNFNVSDGSDGDAIIESVGDAGASKIVGLHSSEQLLVLTDRGPYYCPESQTNPFTPTRMAFFQFGSPWPIEETVRAEPFDGGVVMVSGSLVIKARPTGNLTQSWDADEVSLLASHIVMTPTSLAVTTNFSGGPERYCVMVNSNGSLAVMQLVEAQKIRNFTPWDTAGIYDSVRALGGDLYAATTRSIAGNTVYTLELFDQDVTLDAATEYTTLSDLTTRYGGTSVGVVAAGAYLGTYPLSLTNPPAGPYVVGLNYESVIQTLPPVIDGPEGPAAGDMIRIVEAYVHVIGSARFAANGSALQAYQLSDDIGEPPPELNGPQRFQFLGWEREPTISITQPDPLPLDVLAIKHTVAF